MKANELIIGDWIYSTFCDEPCQVVGIEQYESGYAFVKVTNVSGAKEINSLIPLPLTPEILEKNGFIYDGGFFYCDNEDDNYQMDIHPKETNYIGKYTFICIEKGCITLTELPLTYVHELQHALRLCGIEKEIEL